MTGIRHGLLTVKRIAFASEGLGNFDIYVMNADGARQDTQTH